MSPWELQEEFYNGARHFYDLASVKKISRLFGREYGARRFGLWFSTKLGAWGAHVAADHFPISPYYKLKHYGEEPAEKKKRKPIWKRARHGVRTAASRTAETVTHHQTAVAQTASGLVKKSAALTKEAAQNATDLAKKSAALTKEAAHNAAAEGHSVSAKTS
jgi:hypothetical protein